MQHHVFLSYSRKDSDIMAQVRDDFRAAGLTVWTDEGIEPGTPSWKRAIENAILNTGCLVAILSPNAASSDWVRAEMDFAELQDKPIFLILARGDERNSIPFGFATAQWIDIRNSTFYNSAIQSLESTIRKRFEDEKTPDTAILPELYAPDLSSILPPPFTWREVPEGTVKLETVSSQNITVKGGNFFLKHFYIAQYPITNAQYQVFLDADDGYRDAHWWEYSNYGWEWRRTFPRAKPPAFLGDDLPRTMVNWFDALAFCRWLMARTETGLKHGNIVIRLPTEQQWQRAAQDDDGREYPWGNTPDMSRCNVNNPGKGHPTPVTTHPDGASPYGVMDMSGNVGEWCLNESLSEKINFESPNPRAVRGGSWSFPESSARCAFRNFDDPTHAATNTGFRILLSLV